MCIRDSFWTAVCQLGILKTEDLPPPPPDQATSLLNALEEVTVSLVPPTPVTYGSLAG